MRYIELNPFGRRWWRIRRIIVVGPRISMTVPDKTQLEHELLAAQKEKVLAEIAVLRKTTPLTEAIKVLGSMALGVGGAIAAVAGFQLAEVKAEKYKLEAVAAEKARDNAKAQIDALTASRDTLERESVELVQRLEVAKKDYAAISDRIAVAQKQAQSPVVSGDPSRVATKRKCSRHRLACIAAHCAYHRVRCLARYGCGKAVRSNRVSSWGRLRRVNGAFSQES
jgi:hypothetical protein